MRDKKTIISALILIVVALFMAFLSSSVYEMKKINSDVAEVVVPTDDEQCYAYNQQATPDAPYAVNEIIKLNIKGDVMTGEKTGTQSGPDMTNGYEGILTGNKEEDLISVVFAYTIEGSENQEKEIYRVREDLGGIEKLRYPLLEEEGMLVPDATAELKALLYVRVDCEAGN